MKAYFKYNKLRGRIVEKFKTNAAFARELGISEVSMSKKLSCKTGFSQDDILSWAKLLDIKAEEYPIYFFN